jgi:TRAP-type uncharacterized transport system substrate-binding protein
MPTRSATRLPGLALLGVLLVICPPITTAPAATELGLITGGEKGTYYQFGLNLQRLVKERGIDLSVHPSRGAIENIYAVYQRPGTQLGIVQSDVLAFVARVQSDQTLKRITKKTKMVFPRRSTCSREPVSPTSTT